MVLTKYNKNQADYKPPKESDPSLVVGITHMVKLYIKNIILDYFYFCKFMMFYQGSFSIYQVNLHYTKSKNIKVFKILRPFLIEGVRTTHGAQTYKIVDAP